MKGELCERDVEALTVHHGYILRVLTTTLKLTKETSLMNNDHLEQANNRKQVFDNFLQIEQKVGANADKLAFLDRGIEQSKYKNSIPNYPQSLTRKPLQYTSYPVLGKIPYIDEQGLDFLHPQIEEACISLGKFEAGELKTIWMGRNPLKTVQFWSSTKIIPVVNTLSKIDQLFPQGDIKKLDVKDAKNITVKFPLDLAIQDIVSYQENLATSNSLAALFKRFETRSNLEAWFQKLTGNSTLKFQGDYGEQPAIQNPIIFDRVTQNTLIKAVTDSPKGDNFVSAYDLTRLISLIGWHAYLPAECQLPNLQQKTLNSLILAMGQDTARYVDVALETLGIQEAITAPVILSKMGYGNSETRQTVEACYMAFVQFIDPLALGNGKSAQFRTLALTLRGVIIRGRGGLYNPQLPFRTVLATFIAHGS
ncbi:hypothetical protein [Planktothrix pseudagardhii]|uniref:Uncharacterized protein n=1 Tax=Planktothrix pseudagardhii TaxID=132604 RepID=A0A9W4CL30_9CYAN|nr:hypothetical protein [Planktothrix pseudagardhii]CAD5951391.1 hypothetical protein NO713_02582 [Planktothrix pseudagardhii]